MTKTTQPIKSPAFYTYLAAGIAFAVFVGATCAYAAWGDRLIAGLSEGIGELIAQRATNLAAAGMNDQAVAVYREALAERFENEPTQRILTMQKLAKLLLAEHRADEAVEVMEKAAALDTASGNSYSLLYTALRGAGKTERALEVSRQWYTVARQTNDAAGAKWAKYNEGAIYRDTARYEEALAAFKESNTLQASQESALQCALLLHRLGRSQEALQPIEYVLHNGDDTYVKQAQVLLKAIQGASAGAQPR